MKGLSDGFARYFPSFPDSSSVWIKEVVGHDIAGLVSSFSDRCATHESSVRFSRNHRIRHPVDDSV